VTESAAGPVPLEVELKFQVPAEAAAAVERAVAGASARQRRLRAEYADSDDHRLARAGLALRLRREGRRWVQTLKGRGDGIAERPEHEVVLGAREPRRIDAARHDGTALGHTLRAALGDAALRPLFATDITRTERELRAGPARVAVAFDRGVISARDRRAEVCEVEFELVRGSQAALIALASRWALRHGLWLDVRTKSERGWHLALGLEFAEPVKAQPAGLEAGATQVEAFAAMAASVLAHALPNLAAVACGRFEPEHLHQLRVALRRGRSLLRVFGPWSADPDAAARIEAGLAESFRRLGGARDDDVLNALLQPPLEQANLPALRLPATVPASDASRAARDPALTLPSLELRSLALNSPGTAAKPAAAAAKALLEREQRSALKRSSDFVDLEAADQHRIRKRLKRLRYAAEFVAALFPGRGPREAHAKLRAAAEALGHWNDLQIATARLLALSEPTASSTYLLGWLAGRREQELQRCQKALQRFAKAPKLWA
jgi:inorganic triphosphatase YgiF